MSDLVDNGKLNILVQTPSQSDIPIPSYWHLKLHHFHQKIDGKPDYAIICDVTPEQQLRFLMYFIVFIVLENSTFLVFLLCF